MATVQAVSKTPTLESVAAKTPMAPLSQEAAVAPRLSSNEFQGLPENGLCIHLYIETQNVYTIDLRKANLISDIDMYTEILLEKTLL